MANINARISQPQFHPLSLARAAWKRKFQIAVLFVGLSAAGIAISHRLPAVYKAEALILVDPQKVPERFVEATVTDDLQDRLSTISQEIQSEPRLQAIIDELGLYQKARKTQPREQVIERMRKDIEIKVEKGKAFRVSYEAPDPKIAAAVVDRITNLYIDENLKSRETQAAGTTEFLETQLQEAKATLEKLEGSLSQYKLAHNGELPEQEASLSSTLTRLQVELQGNQDAANRAQQDKMTLRNELSAAETTQAALKRASQGGLSSGTAIGPTGVQLSPDPTLAQLETQYAELRNRYTDAHPDVQSLKQKIASLRQARQGALAAMDGPADPQEQSHPAENTSAAAATPMWPELITTRERITTLKAQLEQLNQTIGQLAQDRGRILGSISSYEGRIAQLPLREQEMTGLMRDYQISRNNYQSLLDKKFAAEMAGDLEHRQKAERFRILDPAKAPAVPFKPKRGLLYIASIIGSLVLSIAVAIALELRKGVFLGYWELPKEVPVLGLIPEIKTTTIPDGSLTLKRVVRQDLKQRAATT